MDIDPIRRNKKPRLLLESERERLDEFIDSIHYSARYDIEIDARRLLGGPTIFTFFTDSTRYQVFR